MPLNSSEIASINSSIPVVNESLTLNIRAIINANFDLFVKLGMVFAAILTLIKIGKEVKDAIQIFNQEIIIGPLAYILHEKLNGSIDIREKVFRYKRQIMIMYYFKFLIRFHKEKDPYQSYWILGNCLYYLFEFDKAVKIYDAALDHNSNFSPAWSNKGTALSKLSRYEDAIKAYDKAIEVNPQLAEAWYNKGVALDKLERYEDAIEAFDEAIKTNPQYAGAWYNEGIALNKLERYEDAIEAFDEAIKTNPQFAEAWSNKGAALVPLAKETESYLAGMLSELQGKGHPLVERLNQYKASLPTVEELTFEEGPLTRKRDEENPILTSHVELSGEAVGRQQQMIYYVECIAGGTMMFQRLASKFPLSKVELGCLLDGLSAFARAPFIGGRGAAGYGHVEFTYLLRLIPLVGDVGKEEMWLDAATLLDTPSDTVQQMLNAYYEEVKKSEADIRKALRSV